jgi:Fic family protein
MDRHHLAETVKATLERLPQPYQNAFAVVPAPPPAGMLDLRQIMSPIMLATKALERVQTLASELRSTYLISRILPRREAVSSSAVEGTYSTLDSLLSSEEVGDDTFGDSNTLQVRDYALALETFLPRAQTEGPTIFTLDLVQDLHRKVMQGDPYYADEPGALRQRVVWIGGGGDISSSTFNPPPPDKVLPCLLDTLAYLRGDTVDDLWQAQSLVTRMAIAHAHFEAVHPFRDGNGRVGRLLLPLMMAADGQVPIYLSPYIEAHRHDYMTALKAAQQQLQWQEMVRFIADAVVSSVDDLMIMRSELATLQKEWSARRPFRKNSAAQRALDYIVHYPVLTVNRLSRVLDVSYPAASKGIEQLAEAGILHEKTGYSRNRVYVASEVLRILNRRP